MKISVTEFQNLVAEEIDRVVKKKQLRDKIQEIDKRLNEMEILEDLEIDMDDDKHYSGEDRTSKNNVEKPEKTLLTPTSILTEKKMNVAELKFSHNIYQLYDMIFHSVFYLYEFKNPLCNLTIGGDSKFFKIYEGTGMALNGRTLVEIDKDMLMIKCVPEIQGIEEYSISNILQIQGELVPLFWGFIELAANILVSETQKNTSASEPLKENN